jgi:predicted acetyltransferase
MSAVGEALTSAVGDLRMAAAMAKGAAMATAKSMAAATAKGMAPLLKRRVTVVGPLPRQPPDAYPLESRVHRIEMSSSEEEDDDKGETETTDMDSDANAAMEGKSKHGEMVGKKIHALMPQRVPQHGSQRTMPCSQCAWLGHDCYEQVNGICACYHCGKAKVHYVTGNVGEVARSRRSKGPAKTTLKNAPTSRKKTSSAKQFT